MIHTIGTLAAAAVIGAMVFDRCLGFAVLDPANVDWIFLWGIDPSVNFMGWHMFRSEAWGLPPGILRSYGHPVGSSIGITDSLPVIAMPLKFAAALLPPTFQYLGLWYLACFVLLAVFGCLLVATATASPWLQVLGASIIALSPTLIHRMGHASLSGHWLVVAALWLHEACRTHGVSRRRLLLWLALLWVAAGVTPYIAAMVVALAVPTIVGRLREGVVRMAVTGLACAIVTGVGWWAGGYFVIGAADIQNSGFGVLSTNLLAPFDAPPGSLLAHALTVTIRSADQLDGYCYLGLGVFWLVAVTLVAARPRLPREWSLVDAAFALVCIGLALFALSSTITLGTRVVFEYDPGWWGPLTMLRASGRFVWPLYYAFVFGAVALVARRLPHRAAVAALGIAVVLQTADLWGAMGLVRSAHAAPVIDPLPSPFWDRVLPRYAHLVLNPTNMCSPAGFDYRYFALKAGQARMTINAGYAARHDSAALASYCRALAEATASRRVDDDTVYVLADHLVAGLQSSDTPVACTRVDGFAVCFSASSYSRWEGAFDVGYRRLPSDDEIQRFRGRLEAEDPDRMRRPARAYRGLIDQRTKAMTRYFELRINGCSDDEAFERAARLATSPDTSVFCPRLALDPRPLPPGEVASRVRDRLEGEWSGRGLEATETFVDWVGEAVWLQAYLDLRLQRLSADAAAAAVLSTIRRIAP